MPIKVTARLYEVVNAKIEKLKDQPSESRHKTCTVFKALQKLDLLPIISCHNKSGKQIIHTQ